MRTADWYVIQVETGRELASCDAVLRACRQAEERSGAQSGYILSECFAPRYRTQFKLNGTWHDEERLLLPGYVVAVTREPWSLANILRGIPEFALLLRMGETFSPLKDGERDWIARWTTEGDRTIPMSVAYKRGDRVVVAEGPLKGNEAMITRINRRLSRAELAIHAGQLTIRTTVGLAVLPEPME